MLSNTNPLEYDISEDQKLDRPIQRSDSERVFDPILDMADDDELVSQKYIVE